MDTKWTTRALSENSTPVELTEEMLQENVVILLQGKNVFGDRIFSYLELTLESLQELKAKMRTNDNFMPSDFGTVLAAGRGEPSDELRSEMAVTYNMIDVPRRKTEGQATAAPAATVPPAQAPAANPAIAQTPIYADPEPATPAPDASIAAASTPTPAAPSFAAPAGTPLTSEGTPLATSPAAHAPVPEVAPAPADVIRIGPISIPKFW